jgi:membrane associated rhomboid family serine protease
MTLLGSVVASVGIPLLVGLVLDPVAELVGLVLRWCLFVGFPMWVIVRAIYGWSQSEDSLVRAFLRDLRPDPLGNLVVGSTVRRSVPVLTIALILVNAAIHYSGIDPVDYAMRMADPSLWPWTNFTSLFMHADGEHLWGNMLFLLVFGSAIEPRVPRARYLVYYLLLGTVANAVSVSFYRMGGNDLMTSLGASGAISGVMGLFVIRCYFARVGMPIPVFGALGAPIPLGYRLHMNAMVLVGLYFLRDLLGARSEIEEGASGIGYLAHVGGYCAGLCLAYATGLAREGRREVLELRASRPADLESLGPDAGARDRVLELDPQNVTLRLARARARSKYVLRQDARDDYEALIRILLERDPDEAARVFAECFRKYWTPLSPKDQLALSPALERIGELEIAARALEQIAETAGIEAADREKALLHQGKLLVALGLDDAASHVYERLLREHPQTALREIVEAKLGRRWTGSAVSTGKSEDGCTTQR